MKKIINSKTIQGFTLVELVVSITIIAILVTLTVVIYSGVQTKARDVATLSDIDQMDVLQTNYGINNNVVGKAYYGDGPDIELGYTPTEGTVIDVVIDNDSNNYCIRAYNPDGIKDSILNSHFKETTVGVCETLEASSAALSTVAPDLIPNITIELVGNNIIAEVNEVTCGGGTTLYQINSRTDEGEWTGYSDWLTDRIAVQSVSDNVKYEYQAQAKCYTSETTQSLPVLGSVSNYTYNDDHMPIATSISGYWSEAPDGYLLEDGSAVSRDTYSDLFDVIGTTYGAGDNSSTFNLPDSRGRVAVNLNTSDAEFSTMGQKYGEKTHLLTGSETGTTVHGHTASSGVDSPNHTHSYASETTAGGTTTWYAHTDGQSSFYFNTYSGYNTSGASARHTHAITINNSAAVSASSAHNNIQPSIVKVSAVKYIGIANNISKLPASTSIEGYYTIIPEGYLEENGAEVSCTTYADLYAALNGGTCSGMFLLPDSRGRAAVNKSITDAEFANIGDTPGDKIVKLTGAQSGTVAHNHSASSGTESASHTHTYNREGGSGGQAYSHTNSQGSHYFYTYGTTTTGGVSASHTHTITVNNSAVASASSAHNNIQRSIVKRFAIKSTPASGSTDYLAKGTSISGYFASAPAGYLLEDGSLVSCDTYAELYAVLNGGTCSGSFNLPDSRGLVTVNKSTTTTPYIDPEFDTVGEKYNQAEKAHTLLSAESGISAHNHSAYSGTDSPDHTHSDRDENWTSGPPWYSHVFGTGYHYFYIYVLTATSTESTSHTHSITVNNTAAANASSAHNNIQPSIVQNFAIKS